MCIFEYHRRGRQRSDVALHNFFTVQKILSNISGGLTHKFPLPKYVPDVGCMCSYLLLSSVATSANKHLTISRYSTSVGLSVLIRLVNAIYTKRLNTSLDLGMAMVVPLQWRLQPATNYRNV